MMERTSPTQISEFGLCPRRWYLDRIDGLRPPQTFAAARGDDVHKELEDYFHTGRTPKNDAARLALDDLPPRDPDAMKTGLVLVETKIQFRLYKDGPVVFGKVDYADLRCGHITDHKTTGVPGFRYALTPGELLKDVQVNAYGRWMKEVHGVDASRYEHMYLYVGAGAASTKPVRARPTRETKAEVWARDEARVREMAALWDSRPGFSHVPPNVGAACKKYGKEGCPHQRLCGVGERTQNMSLLDDLINKSNGVAAPPPAAPAPAPAAPAAAPSTGSVLDDLLGNKPARVDSTPLPAADLTGDKPAVLPVHDPAQFYCPAGFTPAGVDAKGEPVMIDANGKVFWQPRLADKPPARAEGIVPPDAPKTEVAAPAAKPEEPKAETKAEEPKAEEPKAKKGGRKKAAETPTEPSEAQIAAAYETLREGKTAAETIQMLVELGVPETQAGPAVDAGLKRLHAVKAPEVTAPPLAAGFELAIDCVPAGTPVTWLEQWAESAHAPATAKARQLEEGGDAIADWTLVKYNRGAAYFALALRDLPLPVGVLAVRSGTAIAEAALPYLTPRAARVWRALGGVR